MNKVENLSNQEILLELKRYKKGFNLVMEHFDSWDEEQKKTIHKQLVKIDL
jgi:recombinational DNA repair protein RecT